MGFSIQWKCADYLHKLHFYSIPHKQCSKRNIDIG
jgi:hypothetical protein